MDEQGRPLPTYPCPLLGCGREVPVRFTDFRVEHLPHLGWQPLHRPELPIMVRAQAGDHPDAARADGSVQFVDVVGEAT